MRTSAPKNPVINFHLGMVQYKAGEKAKAKESLTAALAGKEPFPGRDEAERTLKTL